MKIQRNRIVLSITLTLATFIAALTWAGLKNFLFNQGNWIWPSLCLLILLIFLCLAWLLLKSKIILFTTLIIILLSFFVVFGFSLVYLIAVLAAFILFFLGSLRAIQEKESRIKLKIPKILKAGLPLLLTGLSVIIATVYFYSPFSLNQQEQIQIPEALFEVIVEPAVKLISQNLSKNLDMSLPQNNQLNNIPAEWRVFLEDILGGGELEKTLSNPAEAISETVDKTVFQTVNQQINTLLKDYKKYIAVALAVSLFFALKFISMFFMWLIVLLTWLIFRLLVYFEAIHIQEKAVLKEVIET